MPTLEEDFPELRTITPKWEVYRICEEPPAWKDSEHQNPAQRWRNAEILRRMVHDYDPDTVAISSASQTIVGRSY